MSYTLLSRSSAVRLAASLAIAAAPAQAQYTAQSLADVIRGGRGMTESARVWGGPNFNTPAPVPRLTGAGGTVPDARDYTVPTGFDRGGDINGARDNGVAVGSIAKTVGTTTVREAVRWNSPTDITRLGTFGVYASTEARDINSSGRLIGTATNPTTAPGTNLGRGFYQDAGGALTALAPGSAGTLSDALAINDAGRIVGQANRFTGFFEQGAAFWDPTGGTYGTASFIGNTLNGRAFDVNSSGAAVGFAYATGPGQPARAFYWNGVTSNNATFIPFLPIYGSTGLAAQASALNDAGIVVGLQSGLVGGVGSQRGFVWNSNTGVLTDLSALIGGWVITDAVGINTLGQILVSSFNPTDFTATRTRTWLLTPDGGSVPPPTSTVPEPASVALTAMGLLTLVGLRARAKRTTAAV